jgi:hypothetical protein
MLAQWACKLGVLLACGQGCRRVYLTQIYVMMRQAFGRGLAEAHIQCMQEVCLRKGVSGCCLFLQCPRG